MRQLQFDKCRWQMDDSGSWLCLRTERDAAIKVCGDAKEGQTYEATIKPYRERRSLDANAYCWVLISKLAEHYGVSPEDVYKQQIRNIGGVYEIIPIREDAIAAFCRSWTAGHIGRMTDDLGECRNYKGYHNIRVWYGSSDYDSAQMSRLIDEIVQECKAARIQTLTPNQLANLKSMWGEVNE